MSSQWLLKKNTFKNPIRKHTPIKRCQLQMFTFQVFWRVIALFEIVFWVSAEYLCGKWLLPSLPRFLLAWGEDRKKKSLKTTLMVLPVQVVLHPLSLCGITTCHHMTAIFCFLSDPSSRLLCSGEETFLQEIFFSLMKWFNSYSIVISNAS